jgi:anti-anti-sigma factor
MLKIQTEVRGDIAIISLAGDFGWPNAENFGEKTAETAGGLTKLIIDLKTVDFMDGDGAGAILALFYALNKKNGKMSLVVDRNSPEFRLLQICAVDKVIPIHRTQKEAVDHLRKSGERAS